MTEWVDIFPRTEDRSFPVQHQFHQESLHQWTRRAREKKRLLPGKRECGSAVKRMLSNFVETLVWELSSVVRNPFGQGPSEALGLDYLDLPGSPSFSATPPAPVDRCTLVQKVSRLCGGPLYVRRKPKEVFFSGSSELRLYDVSVELCWFSLRNGPLMETRCRLLGTQCSFARHRPVSAETYGPRLPDVVRETRGSVV